MKNPANHIKPILCFLFLYAFYCGQAQQPITISGRVTSIPLDVHPTTYVTAYNNDTGFELHSTTTNDSGDFTINLTNVGIEEHLKFQPRVYPNPFSMQVRMEFIAIESGMHHLEVHNLHGKEIIKHSFVGFATK